MIDEVPDLRDFLDSHAEMRDELPYSGIRTFAKTEHCSPWDISDSDAAIIGIPHDMAVTNRPGARYGPSAIRAASAWPAFITRNKSIRIEADEMIDFGSIDLLDCGDVTVSPIDIEKSSLSIASHVKSISESRTMPVILGGDHYCTFPSFIGFAAGRGLDEVGVVHVDAHSDTASNDSHYGEYFHGSFLNLIGQSTVSDFDKICQIGIRGYESADFFEFANGVGLNVFTQPDIEREGVGAITSKAVDMIADKTEEIYVTFDIDVLDPSIAPGTGTPEPGGLDASQGLKIMETLGKREETAAVDIMEVAPRYDANYNTARLAADLLMTFIGHKFGEIP